jgi:predicted sugar kinase
MYDSHPVETDDSVEEEDELLTSYEKLALEVSGHLANLILNKIIPHPVAMGTENDLYEVLAHIHGIQRYIMSNAAARAYPEMYRVLGQDLKEE